MDVGRLAVVMLSLLAICGGPLAARAQNADLSPNVEDLGPVETGLTLAELEALALQNHPSLGQAAAGVQAARGDYVQAGLYPNPTIGYTASEIGNEGTAGQQGAFLEQTFILGGKRRAARAAEGQGVRQAQQQWHVARLRIVNDVRQTFYEALVAQRSVEVAEQLVAIGGQAVRSAESLLAAEQVSKIDLLQARIESDTAKIALAESQNHQQAAWRELAAIVGVPGLAPSPLDGDLEGGLPDLDWDAAFQTVLAESPELAAAQAGLSHARWSLERARRTPIPDLNLQVAPMHDYASGDDIANVQASFAVPLFDRNQGNIRKAQANVVAADREVRRVELDLQSRLAAAFERYANARRQVEVYRQTILPDAKESLDLVTQGYRQEEFAYLSLLTAQRTYFQANLAYLKSVKDLRQSYVEIDGLLLTGSLEGRGEGRGERGE